MVVGIFYGATRRKFLTDREAVIREEERIKSKEKEKHLEEEKIKAAYRDAKEMAEALIPPHMRKEGLPDFLPAGISSQGPVETSNFQHGESDK